VCSSTGQQQQRAIRKKMNGKVEMETKWKIGRWKRRK
jgi:hypothetical protein